MSLESILKKAKYGTLGLLLLGSTALAQNTSHIQGNIKSNPFQTNLKNTTITVKNQQGQPLGTTTTDSLGNYSLNFTITGINDQKPELINYYKLTPNYPNPYNPTTNIDFYTPQQGNYSVNAYNILGQQITHKEYQLQQGKHTFQIEGLGAAGVKILEITGNNVRTTQKMIQLDGSNKKPNIELIAQQYYSPNLQKTTLADSINIIFTAPNHYPDSTLIEATPEINLDYTLQQIPTLKTATIQGHITNQQTNENVKNANIKITNPENDSTLTQTTTNNTGQFTTNYQYKEWTNDTQTITNPENTTTTITKTNYEPKILTQNFQPNTNLEETLNNLGTQHQFTITPYDINGTPIDTITTKLTTNNDSYLFSKGTDGKIHINITDYHDEPATTATLSHLNDEYLQWIIGRTPDQPLNAYNLYQTTRPDTSSPLTMPTLNLTEMQETTTDMYLIPKQIPHPYGNGTMLTMDGDTVQYMMRRDGPGNTKFMPSTASDTTDCVILTWNRTTGNPVDPTKIQNTQNQFEKILNTYTLNNGTQLLNYNLYTIDSTSDPRWQEFINRGFDNTARTWYENITIPGNALSYGQPPGRIKESYSKYSESQTNPIIFTEIYQQMVGNRDPPGPNGSVGYVYKNGNVSDFGKILLRMRSLLDPGTPY